MAYQIKRLLPRHQKIMELVLAGASYVDIAAAMGMTPVGVGIICKSPTFQDELARRRNSIHRSQDELSGLAIETAKEVLNDYAVPAAHVMGELIEHSDPRVRHAAAADILDRTYGKKSSDQGARSSVVILGAEKVQLLQLALSEAGLAKNNVQVQVEAIADAG